MLYERDYNILTPEEIDLWGKAEKLIEVSGGMRILHGERMAEYQKMLPHAIKYHKSLFPNNYLSARDLDKDEVQSKRDNFLALLNTKCTEREILNFLSTERAYFLVGAILKDYFNFGHHAAYAFKEFKLPPNYVTDYLLIGKNSEGYSFVFVEFENPYNDITTKDGSFGTTIRRGLKQIEDWDTWLDSNFSNLKLMFDKYLGKGKQLPREFIDLDKSRIHHVVVAGRRDDFNEKTYRLRRKTHQAINTLILHYDNIIDSLERVLATNAY